MIYKYICIMLIFCKIIISVLYWFKLQNKVEEIDYVAIGLLSIDLIFLIISFFTKKVLLFLPFFVVINYSYFPYINILSIFVCLILLILYKGLEDNFIYIHKLLVSIYFIAATLAYLILI